MPKTKDQKNKMLANLEENMQNSKSIVFTINKGINAEDMVSIRKKLLAKKSKYAVVKKTLFKIASSNQKYEIPEVLPFEGALNLVFSYDDEISGPKEIYDFSKTKESIEIVGGIYQGKFISKDEMISLATMPSKEELYAKLVGSLNSPISGFVNVLSGTIRGLVGVISAIKDKKASV